MPSALAGITPPGQMQPGRFGHGTPGAETLASASIAVAIAGASSALAAIAGAVASCACSAATGAMAEVASALGAQEPFALCAQQLWADAPAVMKMATRTIRILFMGLVLLVWL